MRVPLMHICSVNLVHKKRLVRACQLSCPSFGSRFASRSVELQTCNLEGSDHKEYTRLDWRGGEKKKEKDALQKTSSRRSLKNFGRGIHLTDLEFSDAKKRLEKSETEASLVYWSEFLSRRRPYVVHNFSTGGWRWWDQLSLSARALEKPLLDRRRAWGQRTKGQLRKEREREAGRCFFFFLLSLSFGP